MSDMNDDRLAEIKSYWEGASASTLDPMGLRPTARDPYLQIVVETAIQRHLYQGAKLLDLGCGDGLSTLKFAEITGFALGIDYIANFIEQARRQALKEKLQVVFEQGNVLDLGPVRQKFGLFDIITSIRCLINLPDWEHQARGIYEIAQTLRPEGLFIISEGWKEGLEGLNILRHRVKLSEISPTEYNCFISRFAFEREILKFFELIEYINLGLYHFISRVVQPMFTRPEPPKHTHALNMIAAELVNALINCASFEFCDYSGIYILRRSKENHS